MTHSPTGSTLSVLRAVRQANELTLNELGDLTSLSRPTLRTALTELSQRGLVETCPPVYTGASGRPLVRWRFRSRSKIVVGMSVDETCRIIVAGMDGNVIGQQTLALPPAGRQPDVLIAMVRQVTTTIAGGAEIAAIGVAIPSFVEPDGTSRTSPALPALDHVPIGPALRERFGCTVLVENDVQLAALAEHRLGNTRGVDTFIYVWLGERVHAAVLINGQLHRGSHNVAGSIGAHQRNDWVQLEHGIPTPEQISEWANGADAAGSIDRYIHVLADGIAATALVIDPEIVVLGGSEIRTNEAFRSQLEAAIETFAREVRPAVVSAFLNDDAPVIGALAIANSYVERHILGLGRLSGIRDS